MTNLAKESNSVKSAALEKSWTAGAAGLSSPESVELCRIHVFRSETWSWPSVLLAGELVNLGTKVDSTLAEETVLVCALAVRLLHCMSQGCWVFCSMAFFTNVGARASVVCLSTNHRATSLGLPGSQT